MEVPVLSLAAQEGRRRCTAFVDRARFVGTGEILAMRPLG